MANPKLKPTLELDQFEKEAIKNLVKNYHDVTPFFNLFNFRLRLAKNNLTLCTKEEDFIDNLEITQILKRNSKTNIFEAKKIHFAYKCEIVGKDNLLTLDDRFEMLKNGSSLYICSSRFEHDRRLYISIKNPEYFFEKIYITLTLTGISFTVSNINGHVFGNYRHFEYNDVDKVTGITNNFIECYEKNNNDYISISLTRNIRGTYYMITKESSEEYGNDVNKKEVSKDYIRNYSKQILASYRTKNLFVYVLNVLKNNLPGIINLMNNTYPNFKEICNLILRNETDDDINQFILSNTLAKCDFPSEKIKRKNGH